MLTETGCDAIMIGRGVLGNPWLIQRTVKYLETGELLPLPTFDEKLDMILKHFNYLLKIKPEKVALLEMRTQSCYYLKGLTGSSEVKKQIFKTNTKDEFIKVIENYRKEGANHEHI